MTKQEEIREGIADIFDTPLTNDECDKTETARALSLLLADKILSYLRSQGLRLPNGEALIEVGELKGGVFRGRDIDCPDCKGKGKAGCVAVEPLIKDDK